VQRAGTSTHRGSATHRRQVQQHHHRRSAHHATHQHRTLRYGSTGHDVARVQRRLGVAADGIFGPITQAAVRRFQRHHDHRATGVVGPRTWRALGV
jgi:peptidoglycan hydrolase-like protein with peptidoglycan-binding domain